MRYCIFLVVLLFIGGCAGGPKVYKTSFEKGSVLVLPARDVVQNGKPHEVGVGSGQLLTQKTVDDLSKSGFSAAKTSNRLFTTTTLATKDDALAEAKQIGTQYCLVMALGEFRNAAPMSFRTDFVTLEKAVMYNVVTGTEVWRLQKPIILEKSNIGNHLGLIDQLAEIVSNSIAKG